MSDSSNIGGNIVAFTGSPIVGGLAGIAFPTHRCTTIIHTVCEDVWNKDAGGAVTLGGWFLALGYEGLVRNDATAFAWLLGLELIVGIGWIFL